jgi:hypothetical protein
MVWFTTGTLIVLLVAAIVIGYRHEARQVQARTRRHLDNGGKIGDAPDMMPRHGGGGAG